MANNWVLAHGDTVIFEPNFGPVIVSSTMTFLLSSSPDIKVSGVAVCVLGDEKKVQLISPYTKGAYVGGSGMLTIAFLNCDQISNHLLFNNKPVILQGTKFIAQFKVLSPGFAPSPTGPIADVPAVYPGYGRFYSNTQLLVDLIDPCPPPIG